MFYNKFVTIIPTFVVTLDECDSTQKHVGNIIKLVVNK